MSCRMLMIAAATMLAGPLTIAEAARPPLPPDLILAHGIILTVDPHDSVAQAIAIRNGKVLKVGTDQEILTLAGKATRVVDLHGRTATPGLIAV